MNNNIKFLSIAVIAVAIVGVGLFFTTEEKPKEETVTIRLLDSSTTLNSWEIVKKLTGRDILEEEGVKIEKISSVQSTGGTDALQALLANNIDYAGSKLPAWVNIIAAGGKIKLVIGSDVVTEANDGLVVPENSSVYTAKDIVGKKVGINVLGAERDYILRGYLKQNGLSIDQVQLVVIPYPQMGKMLKTGQVDVAMANWNNVGVIGEQMKIRLIPGTSSYDTRGRHIGGGNGFREDFIKEHPETVKRFVTAHEKSQRLVSEEYKKDPARVIKVIGEIYKEKDGNPELAKYYKPFSSDYPYMLDKDVQYWIDVLESEGKLKPGQIKPSDVYTNEFNPYYKK